MNDCRYYPCLIITITRKFSYVNARGIPTAAYQVLHPRWGTPPPPWQGFPPPARGRVPEVGYPLAGAPLPQLDLAGVPPWTWPGYPPPVWTDRMMDRHVSKHYLPVVLRTRSVIMGVYWVYCYTVDTTSKIAFSKIGDFHGTKNLSNLCQTTFSFHKFLFKF